MRRAVVVAVPHGMFTLPMWKCPLITTSCASEVPVFLSETRAASIVSTDELPEIVSTFTICSDG